MISVKNMSSSFAICISSAIKRCIYWMNKSGFANRNMFMFCCCDAFVQKIIIKLSIKCEQYYLMHWREMEQFEANAVHTLGKKHYGKYNMNYSRICLQEDNSEIFMNLYKLG